MSGQDAHLDARPKILTRSDGATIAYHRLSGRGPGVVFLTGFRSDMTGDKALALEAHCRSQGRAFLRFDYTGHGQSSGSFADGTIGAWLDDTLDVLDRLTEGPQVLVGSSMGGWIMLLAARARPDRIAALLGIAAAPDFTEDLILPALDARQRAQLEAEGAIEIPTEYESPHLVTRRLIEDGRTRRVMQAPIPFRGPVRLLHGMKDDDVPWRTALALQANLAGDDVEITLVKDGDHRLSRPRDLQRLVRTLDDLVLAATCGVAGPAA